MLSTNFHPTLMSDRDYPVLYITYDQIRMGQYFLYNAMVHIKNREDVCTNLHTGETYKLLEIQNVVYLPNVTISGTYKVRK